MESVSSMEVAGKEDELRRTQPGGWSLPRKLRPSSGGEEVLQGDSSVRKVSIAAQIAFYFMF